MEEKYRPIGDGPGRGALFRVKLPLMVTTEHAKDAGRVIP
jgi:hypothetical protein